MSTIRSLSSVYKHLLSGRINLPEDGVMLALCGASEALSDGWTGVSGDGLYSDLLHEVSGTGYSEGGFNVQLGNLVSSSEKSYVEASSFATPPLTLTTKFAVFYLNANEKPILSYVDLLPEEVDGRVLVGSELVFTFPEGIIELTRFNV